ncbi:uncharacterized protein LOC143208031 [Lasioglossum baleicum]|uniref:uncharacterized protein LOC143208031 n=1 Tax=Lasioglossum baleicum TaxID=434251 RepID=UPI003FCDC440
MKTAHSVVRHLGCRSGHRMEGTPDSTISVHLRVFEQRGSAFEPVTPNADSCSLLQDKLNWGSRCVKWCGISGGNICAPCTRVYPPPKGTKFSTTTGGRRSQPFGKSGNIGIKPGNLLSLFD